MHFLAEGAETPPQGTKNSTVQCNLLVGTFAGAGLVKAGPKLSPKLLGV